MNKKQIAEKRFDKKTLRLNLESKEMILNYAE